MSNLKKTAVAVLALSSGAVFAGTMGPVCSAVNVTVPCESTAWDLGGKALYFQPSVTGTVGGSTKTVSTGAGESVDLGKNPKWGWGFMIEGSYHFNTGNDLNLNWYHVGTNRTGGFNGSKVVNTNFAPSIIDSSAAGLTTVTVNKATASIDPKWDMVNLEFGQHVDFGENKSIRFHGGFEFARLTTNNSLSMSGSVSTNAGGTPSFSNTVGTNPTYNGFGPRLGADMGYDWGNGLAIYANGAAALLAGTSKYSTTHTNVLLARSVTANSSATLVVPELEGKLGAAYSYATAQGDLTFDAGWMWINYFNAVRGNGGYLAGSEAASGNFGMQGVYFGLKWLGNVA